MKLELNNGHHYEFQAPATLNQAAPVQNTWYTILDTTANVIIYEMAVNVEDTNETLEVRITIDGQTISSNSLAATHSTTYYANYSGANAIARTKSLYLNSTSRYKSFEIHGQSVKVEVRKTTAAGAGNLTGIVDYGILKAI